MAKDDERLEIDSAEALEDWLKDKPAEWAQVIAVRAALRVFPLTFGIHGTLNILAPSSDNNRIIFDVFRSIFLLFNKKNT